MSQQQVVFARRSDLIASLHTRVSAKTSQMDAVESEIRSIQHEQALRSDATQTLQRGFPHPHSKEGRVAIKKCRERIKFLNRKRSRLAAERTALRNEARYQENIAGGSSRPLRDKRPMRKL